MIINFFINFIAGIIMKTKKSTHKKVSIKKLDREEKQLSTEEYMQWYRNMSKFG